MKSLEDFGFKRTRLKNQLSKKPSTFGTKNILENCNDYSRNQASKKLCKYGTQISIGTYKDYPHDVLFLHTSQRQKILEEFGFKRIPRKQQPPKRPRTMRCQGDYACRHYNPISTYGYQQFLQRKSLEDTDLTWELYEYVTIKNVYMYGSHKLSEIDMDYAQTYLDLIKRSGTYGQNEIRMAQLILEEALKHILHALSHVNRIFGKRELRQAIATATRQYTLLQDQLNCGGNYDIFNLICSCLGICHHSQSFTDMDHTVNALTRQQGKLCSPWLLKLWLRTRVTIIYASNTYTDLLSRRLEKEEYQLSLLAVTFADSLPKCVCDNQPTTGLPSKTSKTVHRELHLTDNQHAPSKEILFNLPVQPYHLLLPTPTYKTKTKLPYSILTHGRRYGPCSADPPEHKPPYLIPALPFRRSDNRAGIG